MFAHDVHRAAAVERHHAAYVGAELERLEARLRQTGEASELRYETAERRSPMFHDLQGGQDSHNRGRSVVGQHGAAGGGERLNGC